ncbi:MAG: FAD-dependent monooxygenase [Planctomycetaceae bacterium]|nr:FAD-dependent monooxygenase [Planctomycetaceae bacterium]
MHVAIVGCGTAGPAAGLLLKRQGHQVTIFERVPEPSAVGAGILIQPIGFLALSKLGLLDPILAKGSRLEGLWGQTPSGHCVLNARYSSLTDRDIPEEWAFGLGLHRGVLFSALFDAVHAAGIPVHCGVEIQSVESSPDGTSRLVDSEGQQHGPFSLVIIADGARSHVRESCGLTHRVSPYGWGALWFIGENREAQIKDRLFQVFAGTKRLVGLLPTGQSVDGETSLLSLFWSIHLSQIESWRSSPIEVWKEEVISIAPQARPLVSQVSSHDQLAVASYFDVRMKRWHRNGLVCLGDASHAMSPQLGQGANLALFDAMILSECLQVHSTDLSEALGLYSTIRRRHLRFYQWASHWLMPFFQSSLTPAGWMRDWLFEPVCRIPFFKRLVACSMAGLKTGIFSNMPRKHFSVKNLDNPVR